MKNTKIEWTNRRHPITGEIVEGATFNPWIGCTKVAGSPACAQCYAEALDKKRFSKTVGGGTPDAPISHWGKGAPRYKTGEANWNDMRRLNRQAAKIGSSIAVFSASLADIFDEEVSDDWRDEFFNLVCECRNLDWMILTKRVAKMRDYLTRSAFWVNDTPQNVILGATMENQQCFDERIDDLIATPAYKHFASMEPLCGPIDISRGIQPFGEQCPCCEGTEPSGLDWVIVGGESNMEDKTKSRSMDRDWALGIAAQCWAAPIPIDFFFKQWGDYAPLDEIQDAQARGIALAGKCPMRILSAPERGERAKSYCVGKAMAGSTLEGHQHRATPRARIIDADAVPV